jgi:group I intron endonuclease
MLAGHLSERCIVVIQWEKYCTGVYRIRNKIDGKVYIGSTGRSFTHRWEKEHRKALREGTHWNVHLQRAWDKYGEENFVFEVLVECRSERERLLRHEQAHIDDAKAADSRYGYNLSPTAGSTYGIKLRPLTDDEKKLRSENSTKMWQSEDHRAKRAESIKLVMETEAYKENMSKALLKKYAEEAFYQSRLEQLERLRNDEEIERKRRENQKAAMSTDAYKAKMRVASLRMWEERRKDPAKYAQFLKSCSEGQIKAWADGGERRKRK